MSRKKKILVALPILLLLLGLLAYFVGNELLDSYSRQFMTSLAKRGQQHGVIVSDPQFVSSSITGLTSASWSNLFAGLQFPQSEAFDPEKEFEIRIGRLDAWLAGGGEVTIQASDLQFDTKGEEISEAAEESVQTFHESVTAKKLHFTVPVQLSDPMPGLEDALSQAVELIRTGSSTLPLSANAILEFTLKDEQATIGMRVEERKGKFALVLEGADLHAISDLFEEALTDAEVEVLADYPLRAAQLLRIKDDAESTAQEAKESDDSVPQDAYRHVLWSYLLTNKYGAVFAKRVTDAHEEGDTGNTLEERDMDYKNNTVGRRLANAEVRRGEILERVMSDPAVVREAN